MASVLSAKRFDRCETEHPLELAGRDSPIPSHVRSAHIDARLDDPFCSLAAGRTHLDLAILTQMTTTCKASCVECSANRFGARCAGELADLAADMEANQPWLQQYDSWGSRVDILHTCASWKAQHNVAAEEGLIALGYEREWGAKNRLVQMAKMCLYSPSSGLYNCPLAMTDGAARLCSLLLDSSVKLSSVSQPLSGAARAAVAEAYEHLTSRDGKSFFTSGQWMTERGGGSDVGDGTRTVARLQPDGTYRLYGFKCQFFLLAQTS
jgi:hypothetical protein